MAEQQIIKNFETGGVTYPIVGMQGKKSSQTVTFDDEENALKIFGQFIPSSGVINMLEINGSATVTDKGKAIVEACEKYNLVKVRVESYIDYYENYGGAQTMVLHEEVLKKEWVAYGTEDYSSIQGTCLIQQIDFTTLDWKKKTKTLMKFSPQMIKAMRESIVAENEDRVFYTKVDFYFYE